MPGKYLWTLWWSTSTAILGIHILQCGELLWMRMTHTAMQCGQTHLHIYLYSLLSVVGAVAAAKRFIYFPFCKHKSIIFTSFHLCFAFFHCAPVYYFFSARNGKQSNTHPHTPTQVRALHFSVLTCVMAVSAKPWQKKSITFCSGCCVQSANDEVKWNALEKYFAVHLPLAWCERGICHRRAIIFSYYLSMNPLRLWRSVCARSIQHFITIHK